MPARVGERERALITERARKLGLGVSEYLRDASP
jgi:ribosomal protein L32E